jgi:hypothetical protein
MDMVASPAYDVNQNTEVLANSAGIGPEVRSEF